MPVGRPFTKGNKLAPGGARPGAGRKTNAFKDKAARILDRAKGLEYLGRVLEGKEFVEKEVLPKGAPAPIQVKEFPDHTARMMAFDRLKGTAHGKDRQEIELTGELEMTHIQLSTIIRHARGSRGLRP
jgi:hypothetical protein